MEKDLISEVEILEFDEQQLREIPAVALAYIGDAVYELAVRRYLLERGLRKVDDLHKEAINLVCAERQSQLWTELEGILSEEELDICHRGRNAKGGRQPHNVSVGAYRRATGIEALIGYLYLRGDLNRVDQILTLLFDEKKGTISWR